MSSRYIKTCKQCGEDIYFSPETIEMIEEGYLDIGDVELCDECCGTSSFQDDEWPGIDADPGL